MAPTAAMGINRTGPYLARLRALMKNNTYVGQTSLQAYIVPDTDAHQSEYIAASDKRRDFLSGFTGSAGTVIVTDSSATLWTDGRYFLQAGEQLDYNWTLMKTGLSTSITQGAWLNKQLPTQSHVGVDPTLFSYDKWQSLEKELHENGNRLVAVKQNLVDLLWEERPARPRNPLMIQGVNYSGVAWEDKVQNVRKALSESGAGVLVVSALDEIAWLLNLRGSDIDYNPVFFSYALVTQDNVFLFVDDERLTPAIKRHLRLSDSDGSASVRLTALPYENIEAEFVKQINKTDSKIWISGDSTSYNLASLVPELRRLCKLSPIQLMKAVKNSVELECIHRAHVKDSVALAEYFRWLEVEVPKGNVTEISGATRLEQFRSEQEDFVGISFGTISGSGPNGAIIHYSPTPATDRKLTTQELYLCDSGAQFRDGTTDVTRTIHLGTPTDYEKECFTNVLKGHIALATAVFPNKLKGYRLDSFARQHLWNYGLEYYHGTGHGIGAFLNVHEGPGGIGFRIFENDPGIEENMLFSDEPGYYEDGKFGIRIESIMRVVKAQTKFNFKNDTFLTFEPMCLFPIQTKLINASMLTEKEITWLNNYHQRVLEVVGAEMKNQNRTGAFQWLQKESQPLG